MVLRGIVVRFIDRLLKLSLFILYLLELLLDILCKHSVVLQDILLAVLELVLDQLSHLLVLEFLRLDVFAHHPFLSFVFIFPH